MRGNQPPSLESLVARFRANGGPANLNADEQARILNHARELGLNPTEVQTLQTASRLGGRELLNEAA